MLREMEESGNLPFLLPQVKAELYIKDEKLSFQRTRNARSVTGEFQQLASPKPGLWKMAALTNLCDKTLSRRTLLRNIFTCRRVLWRDGELRGSVAISEH